MRQFSINGNMHARVRSPFIENYRMGTVIWAMSISTEARRDWEALIRVRLIENQSMKGLYICTGCLFKHNLFFNV